LIIVAVSESVHVVAITHKHIVAMRH